MTHPQFIVPTEALNALFNWLACRWVFIGQISSAFFRPIRIRTECSEHVNSFIDAYWANVSKKKKHHWKTAYSGIISFYVVHNLLLSLRADNLDFKPLALHVPNQLSEFGKYIYKVESKDLFLMHFCCLWKRSTQIIIIYLLYLRSSACISSCFA